MSDAGACSDIAAWLTRLDAAGHDPAALSRLFAQDAHWRDLACLRPRFATVSGREAVAGAALIAALGPRLLAPDDCEPCWRAWAQRRWHTAPRSVPQPWRRMWRMGPRSPMNTTDNA